METIKSVFIHDETEENLQALNKKKQNRPKRRIHIMLIIIAILSSLIAIYFISDISKIKSLKVTGNKYFNDKEILELADLSYDTRHLLLMPFINERKIEANELIKNVTIEKMMSGVVHIEVEEEDIIGTYQENKKTYLLLGDGSSIEQDGKDIQRIAKFPLIGKFSKEQRTLMAEAFVRPGKKVKAEYMSLISEINPHEESYDKNMVEIVMQDGNRVYSAYESVFLLNLYKEPLPNLKKDNECILLDLLTESITTEDCKAFQ